MKVALAIKSNFFKGITMTNPKQMGFFDRIHPVSALINIGETHELLRLTKVIPWQDQIEIAMNCRASKVKALVGPEAQDLGILDSTSLMSDTAAQEAMIPYPNEVGLMKRFTDLVSKTISKAGVKASKIKSKVKEISKKVKSLVRASHLFAKTKEQKQTVGKKLYHTTM